MPPPDCLSPRPQWSWVLPHITWKGLGNYLFKYEWVFRNKWEILKIPSKHGTSTILSYVKLNLKPKCPVRYPPWEIIRLGFNTEPGLLQLHSSRKCITCDRMDRKYQRNFKTLNEEISLWCVLRTRVVIKLQLKCFSVNVKCWMVKLVIYLYDHYTRVLELSSLRSHKNEILRTAPRVRLWYHSK
jgi:hypothetical protein